MAFDKAAVLAQLEDNVRAGYKTFLDGWHSASTMLQEQVDSMDILNPTCTCKRHCDTGQLVMPAVVADDEVSYPYSSEAGATASPFSPRKPAASAPPASHIAAATFINQVAQPSADVQPQCLETNVSDGGSDKENMCAIATPLQHATLEESRPYSGYIPDVGSMGNFGYYAEYTQVLRPPSSICSTNVSTAVKAAPWDKWVSPGKSQAACQTGSSLISKGGAGTSQAATVLQNVNASPAKSTQGTGTVNENASTVSNGANSRMQCNQLLAMEIGDMKQFEAAPISAPQASESARPAAPEPARPAAPEETVQAPQVVQASALKSVLSLSPALKSAAAMAFESARQATAEEVVQESQAQVGPESLKPKPNGSKPKAEANALKSVLSQSPALKSPAAAALSEASEPPKPKGSVPKAPRGDDRKSALSTSVPMTSSAAMALGSLGKVNAKKHSSVERSSLSSTETIVPGASPTTAVKTAADAASDVAKPVKSATRQGGSRSRGPDAKSVISGLNSSSSASALLGPMLQGQPKKRTARPEGADVASVI